MSNMVRVLGVTLALASTLALLAPMVTTPGWVGFDSESPEVAHRSSFDPDGVKVAHRSSFDPDGHC